MLLKGDQVYMKQVLKSRAEEVEEDIRNQVEEIIIGVECPKDFECYYSGFNSLCNAKDIGIESFVECLEKKKECKFSFRFALIYLCRCPLRVYISKKFKK
jgi:hypothetical protein